MNLLTNLLSRLFSPTTCAMASTLLAVVAAYRDDWNMAAIAVVLAVVLMRVVSLRARMDAIAAGLELATESLKLTAQAACELERDAKRWRAFVGCARVRLFGWSGFDTTRGGANPDPDPTGYRHFGAEFWTMHTGKTDSAAEMILTGFADAAVDIDEGRLPGPKHIERAA